MSKHRMKMDHFDDRGLLGVEYEFVIEFGFAEAEPETRDEPGIPAHPYDEKIVEASAFFSSKRIDITDNDDLPRLNRMLSPESWPPGILRDESRRFLDLVHEAIAEHLDEQDKAARESAAEAKFQAMRDRE